MRSAAGTRAHTRTRALYMRSLLDSHLVLSAVDESACWEFSNCAFGHGSKVMTKALNFYNTFSKAKRHCAFYYNVHSRALAIKTCSAQTGELSESASQWCSLQIQAFACFKPNPFLT